MKPIVTEEDKRLVNYLKKKKGTHVYYNRGARKGGGYLKGRYYSEKNKRYITYRSSYELRFFHLLEEDDKVISYEVETVKIPYKDFDGKYKNYIPDVMFVDTKGNITVCEIKPEAMLDNGVVKRKAQACQFYFKQLLKDSEFSYQYRFVTEKELFSDSSDYNRFLIQHGS